MKRIQRVFGDIDALRFVDDRLGEDRRAAFLAHVADDASEAARVRTWTKQNEAIRSTFGGVIHEPTPLWLKLSSVEADRDTSARHASATAPPRLSRVDQVSKPRRSVGKNAAMTAVVAALVSGLVAVAAVRDASPWWASRNGRPTTAAARSSFVDRAIEAHRTFATDPLRPVEIGWGQQAQLEQWLRRRLDLSVHVPDLGPVGWAFLGGRIVPGETGPAAFLVYDGAGGERLGVYVGRAASRANLLLGAMPSGSVASWSMGPVGSDTIGIAITVDRDVDWLSANVEALKDRMRSIAEP